MSWAVWDCSAKVEGVSTGRVSAPDVCAKGKVCRSIVIDATWKRSTEDQAFIQVLTFDRSVGVARLWRGAGFRQGWEALRYIINRRPEPDRQRRVPTGLLNEGTSVVKLGQPEDVEESGRATPGDEPTETRLGRQSSKRR